jgi:Protein of unknown function (DUF2752)
VLILRRGYSVPESLTLFGAGVAAAGALYPALVAHTGGQGLPCPLRTLTGVPCPFCGMTTATVAMTHGSWSAAGAANPLGYLLAALAIGTAPLLMARAAGQRPPPRPWSTAARRQAGWALAGLVALSWLFQLHRYAFLPIP